MLDKNRMTVSFPLEGVYISPNTPGSKVPSHGTNDFGETYAIDFVKINENDKFRKSYSRSFFEYAAKGLPLNSFFGWGQSVYSPVNGEIIEIENDIEERNPVHIFSDIKNSIKVTKQYIRHGATHKIITGNYVMIKINHKQYALLAHLRKGSINVSVGQKINIHDKIGELGHSGNSTMPHLHMQFMDSNDYAAAKGLPFVFESYEIRQGKSWIVKNHSVPQKKDVIRYRIG